MFSWVASFIVLEIFAYSTKLSNISYVFFAEPIVRVRQLFFDAYVWHELFFGA